MADLAPIKDRLAKCIRLFGSAERANARIMTERALGSIGANWTDLGDWIERGGEGEGGKYTEAEMQEFAQAARAEGVEAGIKIGKARASNGNGNGGGTLPPPAVMAEYCQQHSGRLKTDWQRDFVADIFVITRRTLVLSPRRLANLAKIYIEIGGRI